MQVKVYNQNAESVGTIDLPEAVFGLRWNPDLMHHIVTSYAANARAGTAQAKTRGEVRGGGKKPWRQKGTGRARHGSIRSPIWKGGGVAHGPRADKDYSKKINKKMAKKALFVALSAKAKDNEIIVLDTVSFPEGKTKRAAQVFCKLIARPEYGRMAKGNGVLVALPEKESMAKRALKNIPYARADEARNLNAYEVLQYKYLLFPKEVIEKFGEVK